MSVQPPAADGAAKRHSATPVSTPAAYAASGASAPCRPTGGPGASSALSAAGGANGDQAHLSTSARMVATTFAAIVAASGALPVRATRIL